MPKKNRRYIVCGQFRSADLRALGDADGLEGDLLPPGDGIVKLALSCVQPVDYITGGTVVLV